MIGTVIKTLQDEVFVIVKEVVIEGSTKFLCTTPDQYAKGVNMYMVVVAASEIEFWDYMED